MDVAFADRRIVKASLMRITLHAVHAEDYAACRAAMRGTPRASRRGRPGHTVVKVWARGRAGARPRVRFALLRYQVSSSTAMSSRCRPASIS